MAEAIPAWIPRAFSLLGRLTPGLAARAAAELLTRPGGRNPPQPWELELASPAPRWLTLAGGLDALVWGDSGPVILAQHGWRGRPTQFGRMAETLVPRGFRLVAVDAPGHGRSPGRRATPRLLADALVDAAASLGGIQAVIGHSLGGAAAAIAVEFGLKAHRLVLLGTPSRPSRMIAAHADRIGLPRKARQALDRWFDAHAGRPVAQLDLVAIRLPSGIEAFVVHDREDEVIPVAEAELLEPAWPRASFLYTTGLGHRELLADPGVVASVAEFITGPSTAR